MVRVARNFSLQNLPSSLRDRLSPLFALIKPNETDVRMKLDGLLEFSTGSDLMRQFKDDNESSEYFTLLYRYLLCHYNVDSKVNCPNPCNRQPCAYQSNALGCRPKQDDSIRIADDRVGRFGGLFKLSYECECKVNSRFDVNRKQCVLINDPCTKNGDSSCKNGGTCQVVSDNNFKCACTRVFSGPLCEINIACDLENPCKPFKCERQANKHGYRCVCGGPYESVDDPQPRCIDKDECSVPGHCKNNVSCLNVADGYLCDCGNRHAGRYCEQSKPDTDAIQWSEWSPWSVCSASCKRENSEQFEHIRTAVRYCPIKNLCSKEGLDNRIDDCGETLPLCNSKSVFVSMDHEAKVWNEEEIIHLEKRPVSLKYPLLPQSSVSLNRQKTRSQHFIAVFSCLYLTVCVLQSNQ
jgi:hypothetical protein